jgi:hypothetical protein
MTAVEWLVQELCICATEEEMNIIIQAEEMEKQQIIDAHGSKLRKSRGTTNYEYWYTGEQYFNETYKNTNK